MRLRSRTAGVTPASVVASPVERPPASSSPTPPGTPPCEEGSEDPIMRGLATPSDTSVERVPGYLRMSFTVLQLSPPRLSFAVTLSRSVPALAVVLGVIFAVHVVVLVFVIETLRLERPGS